MNGKYLFIILTKPKCFCCISLTTDLDSGMRVVHVVLQGLVKEMWCRHERYLW